MRESTLFPPSGNKLHVLSDRPHRRPARWFRSDGKGGSRDRTWFFGVSPWRRPRVREQHLVLRDAGEKDVQHEGLFLLLIPREKKNLVCFERICDRHRLKQLVIKPESSKTVVSTASSTVAEWKVEDFPGALITCHFYNTHNDTHTLISIYVCTTVCMWGGGREIKKTKSAIRWGTADDDGDDALEKAVAVSVESPSYGAVETSIDQVSIHPQRKLECEKIPR